MQQIVDWQNGNAAYKSTPKLWRKANIVDENYKLQKIIYLYNLNNMI